VKKMGIVVFSLLISAVTAGAQTTEMGFSSEVTNIFLNPDRTQDVDTFNGTDWFLGGSGYIFSEFMPGISLKSGFESDSILRRKLYSKISVQASNITFTAGPYYGVLNTTRKWFSPGIIFDVRLDAIGLFFFTLGFETNFSPIMTDGDYYHSGERVSFGFYVPNGIITLKGEYKTFQTPVDGQVVRDDFHRVSISTEIFHKNFPLRYTASIEFQGNTRDYVGENTHQVFSLMFGNRLFWDINSGLSMYVDADFSLFSFGWEEIVYQVSEILPLGRLEVGTRLRFGQ